MSYKQFKIHIMDNDKKIDVINDLIEINNDRIEGYEKASKETEEMDLRNLFASFIRTSQRCRQELVDEVRSLGGEPAEGTKISGKFYRAWMDVKAALTGRDRKTILDSCEYGEDVAVDSYDSAIKELEDVGGSMSSPLYALIARQRNLIKADHDQVRALRDVEHQHEARR